MTEGTQNGMVEVSIIGAGVSTPLYVNINEAEAMAREIIPKIPGRSTEIHLKPIVHDQGTSTKEIAPMPISHRRLNNEGGVEDVLHHVLAALSSGRPVRLFFA